VATYMIFLREGAIVDAAAMAEYSAMNRSATPDPNMKLLTVYGAMETLEGEPADGVVILEFPSREAAKAWYESPAYQAAIPLRQKGAPYRCLMVEGL
jgi:uncharacterized protein (DUF1330 family)